MRMIIILNYMKRFNMKKIFVVEINEKDKNINDEEVINEIDQQLNEFSKIISNNKKLYIRFKRVGSTWQNIMKNLKKNNKIIKKEVKKVIKDKKSNHLKIVK